MARCAPAAVATSWANAGRTRTEPSGSGFGPHGGREPPRSALTLPVGSQGQADGGRELGLAASALAASALDAGPHSRYRARMSTDADRLERYTAVRERLEYLLEGETDWIAALATIACELHHEFSYYDWTGFYRTVQAELLVIGPYQGGHGCLRIPFSRGVCGAAARTRTTQRVDQVSARADHIACSSSTQSEIVVPVLAPSGEVLAVLDVDSDQEAAFREVDQEQLESICRDLARRFPLGEHGRAESTPAHGRLRGARR